MDVAEAVAGAVLDAYEALPARCKVKPTEWTVLAGIVAIDSSASSSAKLISMATGTKCNGFAGTTAVDPYVLRDCHAEALARRGLLLVLWKDVLALKSNSLDDAGVLLQRSPPQAAGDEDEDDKRARLADDTFRLRPELSLHLFISDLPCGCASEFARVQGESTRVTGAKSVDASCLLSTKPGRSDLPAEKRTRCMSCSDKVMKWAGECGIQGALLCSSKSGGGVWPPIQLSSLVLSRDAMMSALEDPNGEIDAEDDSLLQQAKAAVRQSAERCLARSSSSHHCRVLVASSRSFPQSRQRISPPRKGDDTGTSKGSPSGACMSSICVPHGRRIANKTNDCHVEMLVGMRGVREGASKTAPSEAVASDMCKAALFRLSGGEAGSYATAKQSAEAYAVVRAQFLARFPQWNVNTAWDEFEM